MRTVILFAMATALAAAPAAAQNDTNAAVDANAAMTAAPADNGAAANMDMNALPPEPAATDATATEPAVPPPAPERRGFPWGVIGLVGLVGLMGRKRRD